MMAFQIPLRNVADEYLWARLRATYRAALREKLRGAGSGDPDQHRPTVNALREPGLTFAGSLSDDVVELPEEFERDCAIQAGPGHHAAMEEGVGRVGADELAQRSQRLARRRAHRVCCDLGWEAA